ncbi:MAG: DUF5074 domain-containing protein [Muribaculaceae bacterium]|nr:DUF5074 domain-containing protein [Muribaculaceae bacterium]
MKFHKSILLAVGALLFAPAAFASSDVDYTTGVFVVNEDWYGHQNSTVNYLMPDDPDGVYWHYRAVQAENPGKELGCTNQFGAIWGGRFYFIAKQEKDPGASITGGRITVADAKTLKVLYQTAQIDPSGAQCDGRGFLGVTESKGYVSSSNGIWVLDLNTFDIKGQVKGSANPNAGGDNDKPNTDPTGSLYHGQSGAMVMAAGRVFAAHQQSGLLVIDPATDEVVSTISMDIVQEGAGIGSVVKSLDGNLWISVAQNVQGTGMPLNYLVKVDPATLDYEVIPLDADMLPPSNSWYAWTPDAFVASSVQNCLYWKGSSGRWFNATKVYRYDCETRKQSLFVDLESDGAGWKLYGCSLGVHPVTDEVYMSLYQGNGEQSYVTRRYSASGALIKEYPMIENYWFPSMFVFPQGADAAVDAVAADMDSALADVYTIQGIKVASGVEAGLIPALAPGIYIIRNAYGARKIIVR